MSDEPPQDPDSSVEVLYNSCPHCESTVEVASFDPFEKIACPECAGAMRVRVQFDHYLIQRAVGIGGMSQVFEAIDTTLERPVALKILNRENSSKETRIQQFEREATLTASVSDSHVVRVFSVGRAQGNFYIAMELVDGASYEELLKEKGKLSELQVLDVAIDSVGEFLQYNDNTVERGLFYQAVHAVLEIALDDGLDYEDFHHNLQRMFGKETMKNVLGSVNSEIKFFGLTKTSMKLEGLDRHLKLIESYKKLHQARATVAAT